MLLTVARHARVRVILHERPMAQWRLAKPLLVILDTAKR